MEVVDLSRNGSIARVVALDALSVNQVVFGSTTAGGQGKGTEEEHPLRVGPLGHLDTEADDA